MANMKVNNKLENARCANLAIEFFCQPTVKERLLDFCKSWRKREKGEDEKMSSRSDENLFRLVASLNREFKGDLEVMPPELKRTFPTHLINYALFDALHIQRYFTKMFNLSASHILDFLATS